MSSTRSSRYDKFVGRNVRVTTRHGIYEGKVVRVDNDKLYLQPYGHNHRDHNKAHTSWFFFPILTLVLFDLLAIVLLDGRRCHRSHGRFC